MTIVQHEIRTSSMYHTCATCNIPLVPQMLVAWFIDGIVVGWECLHHLNDRNKVRHSGDRYPKMLKAYIRFEREELAQAVVEDADREDIFEVVSRSHDPDTTDLVLLVQFFDSFGYDMAKKIFVQAGMIFVEA